MKRKFVVLTIMSIVFMASSVTLAAQNYRKMFLGFGLGSSIIGGDGFVHFEGELGYHLSPVSLLTLELGGGTYTDHQIGTFTYGGGGVEYTDGKINYVYRLFAPSLSWSYFLSETSKQWRWRVGPSIGLLKLTGEENYTWKESVQITDIPKSHPESKSAGVFGAHVGVTWSFAQRWFADLEYRLSAHTGLAFDSRVLLFGSDAVLIPSKKFDALTHKITIGVGWRFY